MQIISTNLGKPATQIWKGKPQVTGIYKTPVAEGIRLETEGVRGDTIGNRSVHGGAGKACYLFSHEAYAYWEPRYPNLDWAPGMFGENLTVAGLDETQLVMGAEYRLGEARIRITTPREPCYKLGLRFGDQGIIEAFVSRGQPGSYAAVTVPGHVRPGDFLEPLTPEYQGLTIVQYFQLLYAPEKDPALLRQALDSPYLPEAKRKLFTRWLP